MEEFGTKEEKESLYHGGFHYLDRLNKLFAGLDQVTFQRDSGGNKMVLCKQNFFILKSLYKELKPKMEKEKERQEKVAEFITKIYRAACKAYNQNGTFSSDVFEIFDEWEMELREITSDKGLLMPDKEDEALRALK